MCGNVWHVIGKRLSCGAHWKAGVRQWFTHAEIFKNGQEWFVLFSGNRSIQGSLRTRGMDQAIIGYLNLNIFQHLPTSSNDSTLLLRLKPVQLWCSHQYMAFVNGLHLQIVWVLHDKTTYHRLPHKKVYLRMWNTQTKRNSVKYISNKGMLFIAWCLLQLGLHCCASELQHL